jgi:hypothetical protein
VKTSRPCYSQGVAAKALKDTGVKKIFIICLAQNVQENYPNILKMWMQIQLNETFSQLTLADKVIATDLKLANIIFGLMSHGSAHPCTWCDIEKARLSEKGELRTLENLTEKFWAWKDACSDEKKAKKYGNVIHLPLIKGDPHSRVTDLLPPPELHLLLGPINTLFKALEKEWSHAHLWAKACHVERDAIHGGSFNGNSCNILLSKVDILRSMVPLHCLKYVDCFLALKNVVAACYGQSLDENYRHFIASFRTSYMTLGISVTPKVHAIFFHIIDFCESKSVGLARWSEQAMEAVHSDFKPTWEKYKVHQNHPDYAAKLLRAVRNYNSKHL